MPHVTVHAVAYLVTNALIVVIWLMTGGDASALRDPLGADGFWPRWPIVGWGALLALHVGITIPLALRGRGGEAAPSGPRREWVAVVLADVVDSTRLAEDLGDEAWSEMIVGFRDIARTRAGENGGAEVGTQGDGILLRFGSPREALRCAAAISDDLAARRERDGSPLRARIGVHAGQVVQRDDDVLGRMVNLAARVADTADADEILVTEPVADHAGPGVEFEDRGLVELAGIDGARHVLRLTEPTA